MPSRLPLLSRPEEPVLSLEVQARMVSPEPEEPVQFKLLVRHFLERFFNNEMASANSEGKSRLVQVACAAGLPGLIMALYLYPTYHLPRGHRPYWDQVGDHYFYVVYSLVALGVVTVFEWDFFFPDLLDVLVLTILPIVDRKLFLARIAAIGIFVGGFLFDSNFLAPLVLPAATDPPALIRFLAAHVIAVALSGTFAAAFLLALQGILLGLFGEHLFRRISLLLQGFSITALLILLLLTPVVAGTLRDLLLSKSSAALYFPPFWFLGLYQRLLEGPSALPILGRLSQMGCAATGVAILLAVVSYPFAYWRRTCQLAEGSGGSRRRRWFRFSILNALNLDIASDPTRNSIFQFIGQTLLRVQRYRIYLVMYGGLGLALVTASVLRFTAAHGAIRLVFSSGGLRAAVPIVAFWTIAGLRTSFLAPTDRRGSWIFRVIQGKPGGKQLSAAKLWVLLWGLVLSLGTVALAHAVAPGDLRSWRVSVVQVLVAIGLCLLLTEIFFLEVRTIPFTSSPTRSATHLPFVLVQYLGFFPLLISFTLGVESWLDTGLLHVMVAGALVAAAYVGLRMIHRRTVAYYTNQVDLDEDQEEFPQTLGLRY
jgi:hypothetical protein